MAPLRRLSRPLVRTAMLAAALASLPAAPALAGCPPEPWSQDACGSFTQTSIAMDAWGNVDWRGSGGPASRAAEFSDPSSTYKLCLWDGERLVVAADIEAGAECPGGSCWTDLEGKTRRYRDEAGANGDIRAFDFTGSDAASSRLHAQTVVIGGINLPVVGGLIAQLVRLDTGACLESFVPVEAFTLDDKAGFAASFDASKDAD